MPRPPFAKTAVPLSPPTGDQVRFWLHILEEHALFIRAGLAGVQSALAEKAQAFYQELRALRRRADELRRPVEVVDQALPVMMNFYQFQRQLLNRMITCELLSHLYPLQIDHLLRENAYAVGLFEKIRDNRPLLQATKAQENLFWVRIMEDHTQFMGALVDPSERNVIDTARSFTKEFDEIYLQGRDFVSMLDRRHQDIPAFLRYLADTRRATLRLRDFKKLAEELIAQCRLLGILPRELADHLRREAEHYLSVLAMLEKACLSSQQMVEPELYPFTPEMTLSPELLGLQAESDAEAVAENEEPMPCYSGLDTANRPKWAHQYQQNSGEWEEVVPREEPEPAASEREEATEAAPVLITELSQELHKELAEDTIEPLGEDLAEDLKKNEAKPKMKWSHQWPRPLVKKIKQ
ncbi:MAG: DUF2935 domain-containing protein [Sporomusaceae bacterium]|nr:DUF2935 domain-containing protein [Sporomusaceae bacterium]